MSLWGPLVGSAAANAIAASRLNRWSNSRRAVETSQSLQQGRKEFSRQQPSRAMPARPRRSYRRRRPANRRRRYVSGRRPSRALSFMWPRFKLVKLKVVTQGTLSLGAGNLVGQYLFNANSLNDPHTAGGANLPLGTDQLAALYKKYVVAASRHFVRVHNKTATGSIVFGLSLREPNVGTALASPEAYMELPRTRSKILSPQADHAGVGLSYGAKRFWGARKLMDYEDLHATLSTTPGDPAKMAYISFFYGDIAGTEAITLEYIMTSEFIVLCFDPIHPARSGL